MPFYEYPDTMTGQLVTVMLDSSPSRFARLDQFPWPGDAEDVDQLDSEEAEQDKENHDHASHDEANHVLSDREANRRHELRTRARPRTDRVFTGTSLPDRDATSDDADVGSGSGMGLGLGLGSEAIDLAPKANLTGRRVAGSRRVQRAFQMKHVTGAVDSEGTQDANQGTGIGNTTVDSEEFSTKIQMEMGMDESNDMSIGE